MTNSPAPPIGSTNELAKERNRAAAERTLAAWIQNCLILISFGIAVDKLTLILQTRLPGKASVTTDYLAHWIGAGFVLIAIALLWLAQIQHQLAIKSIEQEGYVLLPTHKLNIYTVIAILGFGLIGILVIWLGLN